MSGTELRRLSSIRHTRGLPHTQADAVQKVLPRVALRHGTAHCHGQGTPKLLGTLCQLGSALLAPCILSRCVVGVGVTPASNYAILVPCNDLRTAEHQRCDTHIRGGPRSGDNLTHHVGVEPLGSLRHR